MCAVPLYPIGIVAELLNIPQATLRAWDREGLVCPRRWHGSRCYSDPDLQRLLFVRSLIDEQGFNLAGLRAYLKLYSCWSNDDCDPKYHENSDSGAKPCWKRLGKYCGLARQLDAVCSSCTQTRDHNSGLTARIRAGGADLASEDGAH